jgi:hypothetical protein
MKRMHQTTHFQENVQENRQDAQVASQEMKHHEQYGQMHALPMLFAQDTSPDTLPIE